MKWYAYLALRHLFPQGKRVPFFTLVSISGVMLGVLVLVVVQTVMNGLSAETTRAIKEVNGDIRIEAEGLIEKPEDIVKLIEANPLVDCASAYAHGIVMAQHGNVPTFPLIRGIDIEHGKDVVPVKKFLINGKLADLDDEAVFLSTGLASKLGASAGSVIDVYSPLMLSKAKQEEVLLPKEVLVAGIFESGWSEVDSNSMLSTLRFMQDMYGLGETAHGISVRLKPGVDIFKGLRSIQSQLPQGFQAYTWMDANRDLLFILKFEKTVMFFIILFIILVASFSIASSLMTTVIRKTKEIGLLGAMGALPRQIAACFCLQGFFIGLIGTTLGMLLGVFALHYRNGIIHAFARFTKSQEAFHTYYEFADIPAIYLLSDFVLIGVISIAIATLAGLIPAIRAARLKPAEALRSE